MEMGLSKQIVFTLHIEVSHWRRGWLCEEEDFCGVSSGTTNNWVQGSSIPRSIDRLDAQSYDSGGTSPFSSHATHALDPPTSSASTDKHVEKRSHREGSLIG